jgi:hypothetical protein
VATMLWTHGTRYSCKAGSSFAGRVPHEVGGGRREPYDLATNGSETGEARRALLGEGAT